MQQKEEDSERRDTAPVYIMTTGARGKIRYSYCLLQLCSLLCVMSVEPLATSSTLGPNSRLIVVGKIIIDEYGKPDDDNELAISIGGGGPQAAFGAALALASLSKEPMSELPARQPIIFVAPVGDDWKQSDTAALHDLLGDAIKSIEIIKGSGFRTPRIQLWHDDDQCIQWKALHDSFGPEGADGLWANRPTADDILSIMEKQGGVDTFSCHVILEGGVNGAGKGGDVRFLHDNAVQRKVHFLGVEPVAFPDETGKVSTDDAKSIVARLEKLSATAKFISPDDEIFQAVDPSFWSKYEVASRQGPKGSVVFDQGKPSMIPVATLDTADGEPINPTGAGNSYSGAMTALRSAGVSLEEAACIASAVGAVFCEYNHIPPWSSDVVARVRQAAEEVRKKLQSVQEQT